MQHRVNWWAIAVSAIAFFVFGWVWYDALFGRAWIVALGTTEPQMVAAAHGNVAYPFILSFLMALGLSYGLARMLSWLHDMTPLRGAFIGFSMGLLIFGTMTWMDYTYEMRSPILTLIEVGYVVIGMAIMGAILGAWKPTARPH